LLVQKNDKNTGQPDIETITKKLVDFIGLVRNRMLPLWIERGFDLNVGGLTASFCGLPQSSEQVLESGWSLQAQAQSIIVLSRAQALDWLSADEIERVEQLTLFVSRYGSLPCRSDGYVCSLSSDLKVAEPDRQTSTHALFMLSSACSFLTYGIGPDLRRSYNIKEWLDIKLKHSDLGWCQAYGVSQLADSYSYVCLLDAFIYLYSVTGKKRWLEDAATVFQVFSKYYYNELGVVRANIGSGVLALDPRLQLQWAATLGRYRKVLDESEAEAVQNVCELIIRKVIELGRDKEDGLFYNKINFGTGHLISASKQTSSSSLALQAILNLKDGGLDGSEILIGQTLDSINQTLLRDGDQKSGWLPDNVGGLSSSEAPRFSMDTLYNFFLAAEAAAQWLEKNQG